MTYFKINNVDFSMYVSALKVGTEHSYKAGTNAEGKIMAQYRGTSRVIEVAIIPLDDTSLSALLTEVNKFAVKVSYLNPQTKQIEEIDCIIPEHVVDYYTIQAGNVMLKAFTLSFTEAQIRG